jgi:hypothetical protein
MPPAEADVILPDCPAATLDAHALLAALELELDHDGIRRINLVPAQRPGGVATLEVALDCGPGAHEVRLRVRNDPHPEVHRAMAIADLPRRLRARAVALAAAELARSTWSSAPRPAEVEGSPAAETDGNAGESAGPRPASPATNPSPLRPVTEPPAAVVPPAVATPLPPSPPQRSWRGVSAGPAARWFLSAAGPAFGGRAAARLGRLRVGADVLFSYDSRFTAATKLGLALGWVAWDALARERGRWRFSTGPRLAAGAGWARTPMIISQEGPLGAPLPASPDAPAPAPAEATRGWYVEGALAAELQARTATGWLVTLEIEAGLGWGIAPGRDSVQPSLGPNVGASLLAGHGF